MKFHNIVAFSLASVILFSGCSARPQMDEQLRVDVATATSSNLEATTEIAGVFAPIQIANITSKISGLVESVNGEVGQEINPGDTVVQLETKDLQVQLKQAQAAYSAVQDQSVVAKSNLSAAQVGASVASEGLNATKSVVEDQIKQAKQNVENAQNAYDTTVEQTTSQLAQAKQNVENAQADYDKYKTLLDMTVISQADFDKIQRTLDSAKTTLSLTEANVQTSLNAVSGQLETAKNAYNQVSGSAANSQMIAGKGNVEGAQSKVDVAQKQYQASASSAIEQAQASIDTIENSISNTTMQSHIKGIIVNKNIHVGELASPGVSLMTIADVSKLKLNSTISQESIPYLSEGQNVEIVVDIYPERVFQGTITQIGPIATSTGSYFPIEMTVDNADQTLKAGLTAHARFVVQKESDVVVPASAIVQGNGETYVYTIVNDVAVKKNVVTGLRNDTMVEILNGINKGDVVAVSNVNVLFDQMPVGIQTKRQTAE